jgi:hypothetical protein
VGLAEQRVHRTLRRDATPHLRRSFAGAPRCLVSPVGSAAGWRGIARSTHTSDGDRRGCGGPSVPCDGWSFPTEGDRKRIGLHRTRSDAYPCGERRLPSADRRTRRDDRAGIVEVRRTPLEVRRRKLEVRQIFVGGAADHLRRLPKWRGALESARNVCLDDRERRLVARDHRGGGAWQPHADGLRARARAAGLRGSRRRVRPPAACPRGQLGKRGPTAYAVGTGRDRAWRARSHGPAGWTVDRFAREAVESSARRDRLIADV